MSELEEADIEIEYCEKEVNRCNTINCDILAKIDILKMDLKENKCKLKVLKKDLKELYKRRRELLQ